MSATTQMVAGCEAMWEHTSGQVLYVEPLGRDLLTIRLEDLQCDRAKGHGTRHACDRDGGRFHWTSPEAK